MRRKAIMIFIGITVAVFASMALYNSYILGSVKPITDAEVNKKLYQKLFKKSRNVELECFENSDFYDKYTLAMKNADTRLYETVDQLFSVLFGFIASIFAFLFMFQISLLTDAIYIVRRHLFQPVWCPDVLHILCAVVSINRRGCD